MSNTPPYIVNLIDRDNLNEETVDITTFMSLNGLKEYIYMLSRYFTISEFSNIVKGKKYIYYIAQEKLDAVKIGVAADPISRLKQLQTGNPNKLKILIYYDAVLIRQKYNIEFTSEREINNIFCLEKEELGRFLRSLTIGEWLIPNERDLRVIIRHFVEVLGL